MRTRAHKTAQIGEMEAQLKLWSTQIDDLAARAEKGGISARIEYRLSIDDLKIKRVLAQARFDEFKAAGNDKWEEFKEGIERAWSELEAAFKAMKL